MLVAFKAGLSGGNPFWVRVGNVLKFGWDLTLSLFIGLLYLWPVLLLLLPVLVLCTRRFLRRYPPVR